MSGRWHLVAGSTGAGKTTFALELAVKTGGVRFSIDEWMNGLYWMDCPEKDDLAWALERIARCEAMIAGLAEQVAGAGMDVILDLGFTQREQRLAWVERAKMAGVGCELHVLDVAADVRWERVCERNRGEGATFSFEVTREIFDFMELRWEPPDAEERSLFQVAEA